VQNHAKHFNIRWVHENKNDEKERTCFLCLKATTRALGAARKIYSCICSCFVAKWCL